MFLKMPFTNLVIDSFGFGWNRFFAVFKLMVLPIFIFLIGAAILYSNIYDLSAVLELAQGGNKFSLEELPLRYSQRVSVAVCVVGGFVLLLPFIGASVRLYRLAALGEEPKFWAAFRFDKSFWVTLLSVAILFFLYAGLEFLVIFLPSLVNLEAHFFLNIYTKIFLGLAVYIFYLILQIRMVPFHAAAACEKRVLFAQTWKKTHGYFWTMFWAQNLLLVMVLGAAYLFWKLIGFVQSIGGVAVALDPSYGFVSGLAWAGTGLAIGFYIFFSIGVLIGFPAVVYRQLWPAK